MSTIEKPNSTISDNPYLILAELPQKNQILMPGNNSCIKIMLCFYNLIALPGIAPGIILMADGELFFLEY